MIDGFEKYKSDSEGAFKNVHTVEDIEKCIEVGKTVEKDMLAYQAELSRKLAVVNERVSEFSGELVKSIDDANKRKKDIIKAALRKQQESIIASFESYDRPSRTDGKRSFTEMEMGGLSPDEQAQFSMLMMKMKRRKSNDDGDESDIICEGTNTYIR